MNVNLLLFLYMLHITYIALHVLIIHTTWQVYDALTLINSLCYITCTFSALLLS